MYSHLRSHSSNWRLCSNQSLPEVYWDQRCLQLRQWNRCFWSKLNLSMPYFDSNLMQSDYSVRRIIHPVLDFDAHPIRSIDCRNSLMSAMLDSDAHPIRSDYSRHNITLAMLDFDAHPVPSDYSCCRIMFATLYSD